MNKDLVVIRRVLSALNGLSKKAKKSNQFYKAVSELIDFKIELEMFSEGNNESNNNR